MATILVLDDRATNREFLVTLLSYAGHSTLEAADAKTALDLARSAHPDLVIADVLMPMIDGFDFVRQMRNESVIASTRVIFYTATYMEAETRALAEACGVTHMLTKPTEPELILETVQAALGMETPPPQVALADEFEREHQRLVLNKLTQKVDELEALNSELEERVAARTAELADANNRLRELNALKDNLLAMVSHDLRSPLGGILNTTELLLMEADISEDVRYLTQSIYQSARQMIDMVSKLLDLSRIEAGKVALEPSELRASAVAQQALETFRISAQAKSISTRLAVAPGEPLLYADWTKLSQILNNLLSNAIKFTPPGGQVTVSVAPEPGGVQVAVADTGLGIPPEDLPHLFEKFRQIHLRGTADERGSGLGLAIVRQLAELHGGRIEISSQVGHGSTFTLHLPSLAASIEAGAEGAAPDPQRG